MIQLVKFGLVGISTLIIDILFYWIINNYIFSGYFGPRFFSILSAISWNFILNRHWTFNASNGYLDKQIIRYACVLLLTSGLNFLVTYFLITSLKINEIYSIIFTSFLIATFNFIMHSLVSFKK
jgi:putative flippase GtrA